MTTSEFKIIKNINFCPLLIHDITTIWDVYPKSWVINTFRYELAFRSLIDYICVIYRSVFLSCFTPFTASHLGNLCIMYNSEFPTSLGHSKLIITVFSLHFRGTFTVFTVMYFIFYIVCLNSFYFALINWNPFPSLVYTSFMMLTINNLTSS